MTDKAVMMGDYVDLKFLPGLKSARVFVDIPIEHSNTFLKMFDAPDRTNPVKVAIARIQLPAEQSSLSGLSRSTQDDSGPRSADEPPAFVTPTATKGEETADKPRPFSILPRSQQCALKCQDKDFQQWVSDLRRMDWRQAIQIHDYKSDDERTLYCLRIWLGFGSRKELDDYGPKAVKWDQCLTDFSVRGMVR